MRPRAGETVGGMAIQRVGFRKAYRVVVFAACWGLAEAEKGAPIVNVDEYGERWLMSRRHAFREQTAFRECFPEFATPRDLLASVGFVIDPEASADRAVADLLTAAVS